MQSGFSGVALGVARFLTVGQDEPRLGVGDWPCVRKTRMRGTYADGRTGESSVTDSDAFESGVLMKLHEHK